MNGNGNKKRVANWVTNNNSLKVASVLIAALIWVTIAMTVGSSVDKPFDSVPVNISLQASAFADMGFYPVDADYITVSARVVGDRIAVNQLTAEDITATVKPSIAVTEPGPFMLTLVPANTSLDSKLLTNIQYTPSEVMVRVDRLTSRSFKIEPVISGLAAAEGFVQGTQAVTPGQVTVRGPRTEVEKIVRCVVVTQISNPLEKTYVEDLPILLLDASGNEIDPEVSRITLEYAEARLVVEILRRAVVPLKVELTNVPRSFPVNALKYRMSVDSIGIAGPVDIVGSGDISEIIAGYIDIRSLSRDSNTFVLPLEIPGMYQNLDGVKEVVVEFDSSSWGEGNFNISGATLINVPEIYDIEVYGDTFYSVLFVGDQTALANMTSEDIVMEVDLAEREISEGEIRLPVRISVPTKGMVWAIGEYNVIIEVS